MLAALLVAHMCSLIDIALFFAFVALILWILALSKIILFTMGAAIHVFLVIAIILFVVWGVFRFVGTCAGGSFRKHASRNNTAMV